MSKRIYELVTDRKIDVNEKYVEELFNLLIGEEKGLEDYIKSFKIDSSISCDGDYLPDDRIIRLNLESVMDGKSALSTFYDKKLLITHILKHEIEHAKGLKRLYEGRNDIESIVNRFSHVDYIKRHNLSMGLFIDENVGYLTFRRSENYETDPGERLAEIRACKYIVNLLKNQRRTKDLLLSRSLLYNAYIRGYKDNGYYLDPPTYTFLMNMGMFREQYLLKKVVDSTKYSLDTRACMGLPITYDEKENVLLRKVRLQRRR